MGGTDKGSSKRQVAFGDRVRHYRQVLQLSQEALAYRANINRTYVTSLESGRRNPSLELMSRLATALEVDLGVLTTGLQQIAGRT